MSDRRFTTEFLDPFIKLGAAKAHHVSKLFNREVYVGNMLGKNDMELVEELLILKVSENYM